MRGLNAKSLTVNLKVWPVYCQATSNPKKLYKARLKRATESQKVKQNFKQDSRHVHEVFPFGTVFLWERFSISQKFCFGTFFEWLTHFMSHSIFIHSLNRKMCQKKICIIQKMCQNKIFEKLKISLTRKLCQKEIPRVLVN